MLLQKPSPETIAGSTCSDGAVRITTRNANADFKNAKIKTICTQRKARTPGLTGI